jgi:hypothetical protein
MSNFIKSYQANVGLNHVPAYQVSGQPFAMGSLEAPVSGSTPIKVEFPYVTSWVAIIPHTGSTAGVHDLRVGFSEYGVTTGSYYFRAHTAKNASHENGASSPTYHIKVSELWFMSNNGSTIDFDVVAGLTSIPASRTTTDSAPSWSGSAGVG